MLRSYKLFPACKPALFLAAVLCITQCKSSSTGPGPSPDVTVVAGASALTTTAFSPANFQVSLSDASVTWYNADFSSATYGGISGVAHHLHEDTGLFDSGVLAPQGRFSFTFTQPGTYTYHCTIHPGMVGTVTVTP